jgi:cell division septation protein DedD
VQLTEDRDWQRASTADTAVAYKLFLSQHEKGKWAEEARIRIENFSLDANPAPAGAFSSDAQPAAMRTAADAASSLGAAQSAVQREPATRSAGAPVERAAPVSASQPSTPAPAAQGPSAKPAAAHTSTAAAAPAAGSGNARSSGPGFGIQLGAFSSQSAALAEWKRLQGRFGSELHGLPARAVPVQTASGRLFRLQAPVGEEARARGICAALEKKSQPCVIVLP